MPNFIANYKNVYHTFQTACAGTRQQVYVICVKKQSSVMPTHVYLLALTEVARLLAEKLIKGPPKCTSEV